MFCMSTIASLISSDGNARNAIGRGAPIDLFRKHLSVIQARSAELLDDVFRLRFQVYCVERRFENPAEYPDGRERDEDDSRSNHFLVLYRPAHAVERMAVGTVRLILPRGGAELPVLRLLPARDRRKLDLPLESTAEVSRFAVPRAFRRRLKRDLAGHIGDGARSGSETWQLLGLLNFWLIRAVVTSTAKEQITHIVAVMEPALLRLLRRLGIEFHPMGGMVEHHGLRQPAWAPMSHIIDGIRRCRPELWDVAFDAGWDVPTGRALAYG
jgi:N-acyl amino acid synthase of PEP-CTERM/exosortase system